MTQTGAVNLEDFTLVEIERRASLRNRCHYWHDGARDFRLCKALLRLIVTMPPDQTSESKSMVSRKPKVTSVSEYCLVYRSQSTFQLLQSKSDVKKSSQRSTTRLLLQGKSTPSDLPGLNKSAALSMAVKCGEYTSHRKTDSWSVTKELCKIYSLHHESWKSVCLIIVSFSATGSAQEWLGTKVMRGTNGKEVPNGHFHPASASTRSSVNGLRHYSPVRSCFCSRNMPIICNNTLSRIALSRGSETK